MHVVLCDMVKVGQVRLSLTEAYLDNQPLYFSALTLLVGSSDL